MWVFGFVRLGHSLYTWWWIHDREYTIVNTRWWKHDGECTKVNAWWWIHDGEYTMVNSWWWMHDGEYTKVNAWWWIYVGECMMVNRWRWINYEKYIMKKNMIAGKIVFSWYQGRKSFSERLARINSTGSLWLGDFFHDLTSKSRNALLWSPVNANVNFIVYIVNCYCHIDMDRCPLKTYYVYNILYIHITKSFMFTQ